MFNHCSYTYNLQQLNEFKERIISPKKETSADPVHFYGYLRVSEKFIQHIITLLTKDFPDKMQVCVFFYSNFSFQSTYLFQPFRQSIKFSLSWKATLYLIQGLCNAQVNCKIILHCKKNVTRCGARWQTFSSAWPSCFDNWLKKTCLYWSF